jgi:hypothetical protein
LCTNSYGKKLTYAGLVYRYSYYYKAKYFPKLLKEENISDVDRAFIRNMLTKPWLLYIFRHSALTQKSQFLPEAVLREHAGWTMSSKMTEIYVHLSGESSKILLQKKGIIKSEDRINVTALRPRQCPNCSESNKIDSRFCVKCRMILCYDAYERTVDEQKEKEDAITTLSDQVAKLTTELHELRSLVVG